MTFNITMSNENRFKQYLVKMLLTIFATKQNCTQQMSVLFVERHYFRFQDEIKFSSSETIETLRFRQFLWLQYEVLLSRHGSYYLCDRSLLMSWRNIIFAFFSNLFKLSGTLVCVSC